MKIALVLCPAWNLDMPHLAFALLKAALRQEGHEAAIFDYNAGWHRLAAKAEQTWWEDGYAFSWGEQVFTEKFIAVHSGWFDEAVDQILASGCQAAGFSVYSSNELLSLELSRRLKARAPYLQIIWGGGRCSRSLRPERLLDTGYIDTVIIGEGDLALPELLTEIERGGNAVSCPGAITKKDGIAFDAGDRPPCVKLDTLPSPDFSGFDLALYRQEGTLPALFSRGCINRCVFCSVNSMWGSYRSLSGRRMLEHLLDYARVVPNLKEIFFFDPLINGNIQALEEFCDALISAREAGRISSSLRWRAEATIRQEMTAGLLGKLRSSGCYNLSYGLESGSERILQSMRKRFSIALADEVVRLSSEAGILVDLNFMFGFPGETDEDFRQSLDFLSRNKSYIHSVIPSEGLCYIEEGTYLHGHLDEFGIGGDAHSDYWRSRDGKNTYDLRFERFEEFCRHAQGLGILLGSGYETVKLRKQQCLARYYRYRAEQMSAAPVNQKEEKR